MNDGPEPKMMNDERRSRSYHGVPGGKRGPSHESCKAELWFCHEETASDVGDGFVQLLLHVIELLYVIAGIVSNLFRRDVTSQYAILA